MDHRRSAAEKANAKAQQQKPYQLELIEHDKMPMIRGHNHSNLIQTAQKQLQKPHQLELIDQGTMPMMRGGHNHSNLIQTDQQQQQAKLINERMERMPMPMGHSSNREFGFSNLSIHELDNTFSDQKRNSKSNNQKPIPNQRINRNNSESFVKDKGKMPIEKKQKTVEHSLKLKMPMEIGDMEEWQIVHKINIMQQQINDLLEGQNDKPNIANCKLVLIIWQIFSTTLIILGFEVKSISEIKAAIVQNVFNFDQLILAIYNSNPQIVFDRIQKHLYTNEYFKKNLPTDMLNEMIKEGIKVGDIFEQIDNEAIWVFGQQMFGKIEENLQKIKAYGIENDEIKRLKLFFFYVRLYRKLLGFLEMPFIMGKTRNVRTEKIGRKVMICWIEAAKKRIAKEFDNNHMEQMINVVKDLEKFDNAKEKLCLVLFAVQQTVAALFRRAKIEFEQLFQVLDMVNGKNIVCEIIINEPIDLDQLAQLIALVPNRIGVATQFLYILLTSMENFAKEIGTENSEFKATRIANIYQKVYQKLKEILSEVPDLDGYLGIKKKLMAFMEKSEKQLTKFIQQFNEDKNTFNDKSEKGFISDYLMVNCMHFLQ
ncbi:hypothetical protein niasHT_014020 [Heterodera trifolii]|uniref:Uncharacterized protein n=1 Tax=Heterodera trifolii TaxID=157864 RepID=A0ABD2KYK3_9BILA